MILITRRVMCISLNSWIRIWVILEINTLCFCAILKTHERSIKSIIEARIKYFVIQSVSSALLIIFVITRKIPKRYLAFFSRARLLTLMLKIAASPFHIWFVSITKHMKWKNATILMTWQKLAPVLLLIHQAKLILFIYVILSALVGAISQIRKKVVMEVIAFSSVFNLRWIMAATLISTKVLMLYLTMYWSTVVFMIHTINSTKMKSLEKETKEGNNKWVNFAVLLNLAGIPPLAGFLSKWLVFSEISTENHLMIVTVLLIIRSVNLYIYIRIINFDTLTKRASTQKSPTPKTQTTKISIAMLTLLPLPLATF